MKIRKMLKQEARAKISGYHKNPPPTAAEQARIVELVNEVLAKRQNVQLQLV